MRAKEEFNMDMPIDQDLDFLRTWLSRPGSGDNYLRGHEASIWSSHNTHDLISLRQRSGEHDIFANWLANTAFAIFHRYIGYRVFSNGQGEEVDYTEYKNSRILGWLTVLVTLLSSTIPVTSTVALYFVKGMPLRLCMVAVFITLFCPALALFTNARRIEIFAATAA